MRHWNRFDVPDLAAVLRDRSVAAELARVSDSGDSHLSPLLVVPISVVGFVLRVDVRIKIEASDVIITAIAKGVDDRVHN